MALSKAQNDLIAAPDVEATPRTKRQFPPITESMPDEALVRVKQIIGDPACDPPLPGLMAVSRSDFYNKVRNGYLPPPVRFPGSSAALWRLGDLRAAVARLTGGEQ